MSYWHGTNGIVLEREFHKLSLQDKKDKQTKKTCIPTDKQTDKQTNRETERQRDRQTDKQTNKQTNIP